MIQGGLVVDPAADVSAATVGATGGRPSATGSPPVTEEAPNQMVAMGGQTATTTAATATTATETGGVDRLLAGTVWTRDDVELVLQTLSTLLLLYWAVTEVSDGL